MNIQSLKREKSSTHPYTKSIKIKVLKVTTDWTSYTRSNGKSSKYIKFYAADGTDTCKAIGYDISTQEKFIKENSSILIKNYTYAQDSLKLLTSTKLYRCEPVVVPDEIAKSLASSTQTLMQAAEVQNSPVKALVSLEGTIIKEEAEKTVDIGNRQSKVKELTLKDQSGEVKVSLWGGAHADVSMKCGDAVRIEDGIVKFSTFHGENTISVNSMAVVQQIEVKEEITNSKIIAVTYKADSNIEVIVEVNGLDREFNCKIITICNYLNLDIDESNTDIEHVMDTIAASLPIECTIYCKGSTIIKIE